MPELKAPRAEKPYRLWKEDDTWVAADTETDVVSQGATPQEAVENLQEALEAHGGEGREPTAEELEDLGIDPANSRRRRGNLPEVLK
ncbi:MAG: hypothetical protein MAG715_00491 [Methanonatronarchaeales archaeon]|nr:hypothetical protein [Methanonatronarchaeales archaeon]